MPKSALRRRINPGVPLEIHFEDARGEYRQRFQLCFNLNVLANISERTGVNALEYFWNGMDANLLRAVLWAALLPCHPEFDTRDAKGQRTDEGINTVGSWLMADNQARTFEALWEAYLLYLPEAEAKILRKSFDDHRKKDGAGEGERPLDRKSDSAGSNSGPSADTTSESLTTKSAS